MRVSRPGNREAHREDPRARARASGPLVLELVATARRENGTFLLARRAATAEIAGSWSPTF